MTDKYKISVSNGITVTKFLTEPTYDEVKDILDIIAKKYPYEKRLYDMSDIKFNFTTKEIKDISEYGKRIFTKPNKLAIYTIDDLAFGEMRQFMVYREQDGHSTPIVFRDVDEAIQWLLN